MMASASEPHSRPSAGTSPLPLPLARKKRSSPAASELSCRIRRRRVTALLGRVAWESLTARALFPSPAGGCVLFESVSDSAPVLAIVCSLLFIRGLHSGRPRARRPVLGPHWPEPERHRRCLCQPVCSFAGLP